MFSSKKSFLSEKSAHKERQKISHKSKLSFTGNAVIRGTFILTIAGILSRCIGFFYRIFLTRAIGAEGIGLFQLVTPVMGIVFAICSSGIQTGISRYCAAKKDSLRWLLSGLCIAMPLSLAACIIVYSYSGFIAARLLLNPDCAGLLRILSLAFPFSTFHNCINGYYYGHKKAGIPAFSQFTEQLVRVAVVFLYAYYCEAHNIQITAACALYGNLAGEIASFIFCCTVLLFSARLKCSLKGLGHNIAELFSFALPLTSNRLLMHLLQSGEAILIPAQLMLSGFNRSEATSLYGILNGMALPLILFPSAITNALSVMLLPEISQAQSANHNDSIARTFNRCLKLCSEMGIMSTLIFIFYGSKLGAIIFDEPLVYSMVLVLAWLCPFIYLATTLGSILNGLGETSTTCIHNIIAILIRISFLIFLVPDKGITAYLIGLLVSQIFVCIAHYIKLSRMLHIAMKPYSFIVAPAITSIISTGISLIIYSVLKAVLPVHEAVSLCLGAFTACIFFFFIHFVQINRGS